MTSLRALWQRLFRRSQTFTSSLSDKGLARRKFFRKLVVKQLRGDDTGEGHVVGLAKGLSLIDLGHQLGDGAGMKEAGFAQSLLRK